jgi:hypothetical protein
VTEGICLDSRQEMAQRSMMTAIFTSFQKDFKANPPAGNVKNVEEILADKLNLFKEGCPANIERSDP